MTPPGPAPALDCTACGRTIGKRSGHNLTDDGRVMCSRCIFKAPLHASLWPDCTEQWHDVFNHLCSVSSTRAGVAAELGVWPA